MALTFPPIRLSTQHVRVSLSTTVKKPSSLSTWIPASRLRFDFHLGLRREESLFVIRATAEQAVNDQSEKVDQANEDECELVSRLELTLGEDGDGINAYLVKAMKNNNGAAVLLLTDAFGYNSNDTRDFAYRLSCFGYNVLVPDLFQGTPWDKGSSLNEFKHWEAGHSPERVEKVIRTAADWLREEITAAGVSKKLGLLGFSFGGGHILEVLAKDTQDLYATAVCVYPTRLDEIPVSNIRVPILLIGGDKDDLCHPSKLQYVASQIKGSQARIYPGRGHAFVHCPNLDDDEDAESAFAVMKAWLHDKLVLSS
ncbi:hypothetical protein KP509_22G002600 [Ceratopteris richardii]|uniref:Carboxymethylenebutenolidase homolog n=1 Tax=Ceratopteris richardii TaxID=49495 RepID=A0A8T2S4T5_CERRI|nr:hypothetical protein KP509_22G002600 [Ceratopteris richardii]